MRLLSLDYDPVYGGDETVRSSFSGDISVFDFDVVFWDPAASLGSYVNSFFQATHQGLPSLSDDLSVRIKADAKRRREEFVEFVNGGRVLVVFTCPPQRCYVDTGRRSYSGTGRNRTTTRHVELFDLLSALPVDGWDISQASGSRISITGGGPISSVMKKYKGRLSYKAVMTTHPGVPLARVTGTERIVSFIQGGKKDGYLILLPAVDFRAGDSQVEDDEPDGDEEEAPSAEDPWLPAAYDFQLDLLTAIGELNGAKDVARPTWASRYATDGLQRLRREIVEQQKQIEEARAKLADLQKQSELIEARDQLYLGSGRALELEVKDVLELLGGVVTEPEPGRDDWKVSFPDGQQAVVEVKGVSKSAAEKHAAQLEKWVANTFEESGVSPKGILVVNTWREKPLDERTEDDFPNQMIPYSTSRGHCLITGLQLFVMRCDLEENPNRAEHWRKRILDTSGVFSDCTEWAAVIQEISVTQ
ncbi:hypothetical protein GA0074695_5255 [Micromonospora viridifaciens]|uniref:Uncharacterized protein n=1 Tax=Micromonospora viridifaciens TaxID=1881 RepID=A0A1C4Z980_MICVI|nr:hypothetical protein [Micromonospora viridifaciens]SCF29447.1 hypothetical protein GA0074695_5255 [Micromonospora viridifaciens]